MTQLFKQYFDIKERFERDIVLFRLGDFYEIFGDDAKYATSVLFIRLTKRSNGDKDVAMCGIPAHSYHEYALRLVQSGKNVVICDQMETPEQAQEEKRSIVRRAVTKILTRSNVMFELNIKDGDHSFIMAAVENEKNLLDILFFNSNTGEYFEMQDSLENLISIMEKINIGDIIMKKSLFQKIGINCYGWVKYQDNVTILPEFFTLKYQWKMSNKDIMDTLLWYVEHMGYEPQHFKFISITSQFNYAVRLDGFTIKSMELIHGQHSLFNHLNETTTPMGYRKLREWIVTPITHLPSIHQRLNTVEIYKNHKDIITPISNIIDMPKFLRRVRQGKVCLEELWMFGRSIKNVINFLNLSKSYGVSIKCFNINIHDNLLRYIQCEDDQYTINSDIFMQIKAITEQFHQLIQRRENLIESYNNTVKHLGVTFKLKESKDQCFLEIPRSKGKLITDSRFISKPELKNSCRYTTSELIDINEMIDEIHGKLEIINTSILKEISDEILLEEQEIIQLSNIMGELDVLHTFSRISEKYKYIKPKINDSFNCHMEGIRHPIVEKHVENYVENNINLTPIENVYVITGPNMGGKSTLLRSVMISIIMAQIGCFVPCDNCEFGFFDGLFSRIGAEDNIVNGQSTFKVEMDELSISLKNSTPRSFILLDEVGRGTTPKEGIAIAKAVLMYIHKYLNCRCLFATHLLESENIGIPTLKFMFMSFLKEENGNIKFLYILVNGFTDYAFGIQLAEQSHMPPELIQYAKSLLL